MNEHLRMIKVYNDKFNVAWKERTGTEADAGMSTLEIAIIAVALIGLAAALVVLLNNAFTNRSAGLN